MLNYNIEIAAIKQLLNEVPKDSKRWSNATKLAKGYYELKKKKNKLKLTWLKRK
jgi:hypothetical protein